MICHRLLLRDQTVGENEGFEGAIKGATLEVVYHHAGRNFDQRADFDLGDRHSCPLFLPVAFMTRA